MQLRILRALTCPGGHDASEPGIGCVNAGDKRAGSTGLDWQAAGVEGRMFSFSDEGLDASTCEQCGAEGPWMVARPAGVTEWIWRLCRCGGAEPLMLAAGTNLEDLAWEHFTTPELERAAAERGFGRLIPWNPADSPDTETDAAGIVEDVLPAMSRGGTPQWRGAARVAAALFARSGTGSILSRGGNSVLERALLLPALGLTALIAYVVADASGLAPEQLDLPQILSAGADAVYARLAAHLPGPEAMAASGADPDWAFRVERWPGGSAAAPASEEHGDPAVTAWASLSGAADPGAGPGDLVDTPSAHFNAAFESVCGIVTT